MPASWLSAVLYPNDKGVAHPNTTAFDPVGLHVCRVGQKTSGAPPHSSQIDRAALKLIARRSNRDEGAAM